MPQNPRIIITNGHYHIVTRSYQEIPLFPESEDKLFYINLFPSIKKRFNFYHFAYVLMDTHTHHYINSKEANIDIIMQSVNNTYARYYNKKYNRKGHVYQRRYWSYLIDEDNYMLELVRYIVLNPVRAGIVKSPEEFLWSSHHIYLDRKDSNIVDKEIILEIFSKRELSAIRKYKDFINDRMEGERREKFYKNSDKRFGEDKEIILKKDSSYSIPSPENHHLKKRRKSDLLKSIANMMQIPVREIRGSGRKETYTTARWIFGLIGREYYKMNNKQAAKYLGISPSSLSEGIYKIKKKIEDDKKTAKIIEMILDDILE